MKNEGGKKAQRKRAADVTAGNGGMLGRGAIRVGGFGCRSSATADAARSIARASIISLCPKMRNAPKGGVDNHEYRNEYHWHRNKPENRRRFTSMNAIGQRK
ncbi:hypothetical protein [Burkholderia seminalis]|uniref:hypothetical protein n=1 Tax=Burkholderia seminalis TaxID=488731 RepID=UPI000F5A09A6|nr:hypothetical protein [Burkholderia seminalis]